MLGPPHPSAACLNRIDLCCSMFWAGQAFTELPLGANGHSDDQAIKRLIRARRFQAGRAIFRFHRP